MSRDDTKLRAELKRLGNPKRAEVSQYYFKTGKGEYGYGDEFLGISMPAQRVVAKKYLALGFDDIQVLLDSNIHEERMVGVLILTYQFPKADKARQEQIYKFYLQNASRINNWDLVDCSAEYIVGAWIRDKDRPVLVRLAKSKLIWERRIAMLSTFAFIKEGESKDAFAIATLLVHDQHDLIQKAVGWMLREVGKKAGQQVEESFLKQHYKTMPRTMLRYAIERFPETKRKAYLNSKI